MQTDDAATSIVQSVISFLYPSVTTSHLMPRKESISSMKIIQKTKGIDGFSIESAPRCMRECPHTAKD